MKTFTKSALTIITIAFVIFPHPASAAESVIGDWEILLIFPIKTNLRTSSASMTIAKDANGKYEGKWSTMRAGESSASDVKFENDKLSFVVTGHIAEKEIKTTFTATVKRAKMTGKGFTSVAQFDFEGTLEGEPKTGADAVVGKW